MAISTLRRGRHTLLLLLVPGSWAVVVFGLWAMAAKWTAVAVLLLAGLAATWFVLRQFWSRTSLRAVVFVFPVLIAIACLPLRVVIEARYLRDRLAQAGVLEYQLGSHPHWSWCGQLFGNSDFHTRLITARLDLAWPVSSVPFAWKSPMLRYRPRRSKT